MRKLIRGVATTVFAVYFLGAIGAVPYFNWQYARDNGFVRWLLFGQFVPTVKAFVWPYYALRTSATPAWTDEEKQNVTHFFLSSDASQAATKLGNLGSAYSSVPDSEIQEMQRLRKIALDEARLVRDEVLDKALPGMSKQWREKHQRGLELQIRAIEERDASAEISGSSLHDEWVDWINEHRSEVRIPK